MELRTTFIPFIPSNKSQYTKSTDKKQQNIGRSRWFFNLSGKAVVPDSFSAR